MLLQLSSGFWSFRMNFHFFECRINAIKCTFSDQCVVGSDTKLTK